MAYNVLITKEAIRELDDILTYLETNSKKAASEFIAEYEKALDNLRSGRIEYRLSRLPELQASGYRSVLVGSSVVLYKVREDTAYIAHIFHQRQDYARLV